jgi:hypothetical protein
MPRSVGGPLPPWLGAFCPILGLAISMHAQGSAQHGILFDSHLPAFDNRHQAQEHGCKTLRTAPNAVAKKVPVAISFQAPPRASQGVESTHRRPAIGLAVRRELASALAYCTFHIDKKRHVRGLFPGQKCSSYRGRIQPRDPPDGIIFIPPNKTVFVSHPLCPLSAAT